MATLEWYVGVWVLKVLRFIPDLSTIASSSGLVPTTAVLLPENQILAMPYAEDLHCLVNYGAEISHVPYRVWFPNIC